MGIAPNPRTWVDGEIVPYDVMLSEAYATITFMLRPPMAKFRAASTQSIPSGVFTAVDFNVEDLDPYQFHSVSVNPSRIVPTFPGWYRGWMSCGFTDAVSTGNYRAVALAKNGVLARSRHDSKPADDYNRAPHGVPFLIDVNGTTDYLQMLVYQDSGTSRTLSSTQMTNPEFFLRWWRPL